MIPDLQKDEEELESDQSTSLRMPKLLHELKIECAKEQHKCKQYLS